MNDEQKTCLWIGIAVIVLMAIFPPTRRGAVRYPAGIRHPGRPQEILWVKPGYTLLFAAKVSEIGFGKLFLQWAVAAVVTAALIYTHKTKKDNKKQKICLLIGIVVIVLMAIFPPAGKGLAFFFTAKAEEIEYAQLLIQCSVVSAITAGLFYTLRDKKDKKLSDNQKQ